MGDSDDDGQPRFNRDEAERILGRAASLARPALEGDVTLAQLEAAAEEAGIERVNVHRALAEVEAAPPARRYGMQTRLVRRRFLPARLDAEGVEALMTRADGFFGAQGHRSMQEHGGTWVARHIHLTIEPRRDGTVVQLSERFVNTIGARAAFAMMASVATAMMAFVLMLPLIGLWAGLVFPAVMTAVGWTTLRLYAIQHRRRLQELEVNFDRALDSLQRTV